MKKPFIILFIIFGLAGCKFWTNFTTYFNTYYNADLLIEKTEQEFEYYDETKRIEPRTFAADYGIVDVDNLSDDGVPYFMQNFVISQAKLQPVKVKLDSVIIKGSKILVRKSKSSYVEGTLYLMALAYFYKGEWLPSQVKCGELIDIYPEGEKSPDAHLLFAKSLLIQRKWDYGLKMLSRTVDIAWQLERYDILSEAFRLQADLSLYKGDKEGAMRPYLQAIAQTDDKALKAKWQIEMASLLYQLRQYERAELAFHKVNEYYSPDYVGMFEAYLYEAECAARLGKFDKADELLTKIENDGKFEEWKDHTFIGRMDLLRLKFKADPKDTTASLEKLQKVEAIADSAYQKSNMYKVYQYERAMDYYYANDFGNAETYFAKARSMRSEVFIQSNQMYTYLTQINRNMKILDNQRVGLNEKSVQDDSSKAISLNDNGRIEVSKEASKAAYIIARTYEKLKQPDSMKVYYQIALAKSDTNEIDNARYLYAVAMNIREIETRKSDSLLQLIVDRFPRSEYGVITAKMLGFTEHYAIDSASEYFKSGTELRKQGMFKESIVEYKNCYRYFPTNNLSPKSLYSIAWIFENKLIKLDSALFYYKLLQEKYPKSEFSQDLALSIVYLDSKVNGTEVPDSLKYDKMKKNMLVIVPPNDIGPIQVLDRRRKEPDGLLEKAKQSFKNFFKETLESTLGGSVDSLKSKYNDVKNFDLDSVDFKKLIDPKKLLPNQDSSKTIQDSTRMNTFQDTTKSK